jgi:hypothetical protein
MLVSSWAGHKGCKFADGQSDKGKTGAEPAYQGHKCANREALLG